MDFYEWDEPVRAAVFGGMFLAALFITLWVWYDTAGAANQGRWGWRLAGVVFVVATVPAVVLGAANLDQDREGLLNLLAWLAIAALIGTLLLIPAYVVWGRVLQDSAPMPLPDPAPTVERPTLIAPPTQVDDRPRQNAVKPAEAYLFVKAGPDKGKQFPLAESVTIGRSDSCAITLADRRVSSEHAQIKRESGTYMFLDLRSTNGSFLIVGEQEQPLRAAQALVHGDEIRLGHTLVEFIDTRSGATL